MNLFLLLATLATLNHATDTVTPEVSVIEPSGAGHHYYYNKNLDPDRTRWACHKLSDQRFCFLVADNCRMDSAPFPQLDSVCRYIPVGPNFDRAWECLMTVKEMRLQVKLDTEAACRANP